MDFSLCGTVDTMYITHICNEQFFLKPMPRCCALNVVLGPQNNKHNITGEGTQKVTFGIKKGGQTSQSSCVSSWRIMGGRHKN